MSKQIPLTQGQFAIVDDWRFTELSQWIWYACWSERTQSFYATRIERGTRKRIQMHRFIMNTPKGMECDHRSHNTLDNQEHNLRNATRSQNAMNGRLRSSSRLRQKNITFHHNHYWVRIKKDYEIVYRENFKTLDEAINARDKALKQHHGEFANFGE